MIYDHTNPKYMRVWLSSPNRFNGAYFYSREIVSNIIPNVRTGRSWVTINAKGCCEDGSIVFIHNNLNPGVYGWLGKYRNLILVCGVPDTVPKMAHLGNAVYLPLSVDVPFVSRFLRPKDKDAAFAGRRSKRNGEGARASFPEGTDFLEDMPRNDLLREMARYRSVYAVGRCAIEARVLGCEILPYDPRYPDPSFWKVIDNREAAQMLQGILDVVDG